MEDTGWAYVKIKQYQNLAPSSSFPWADRVGSSMIRGWRN